MSDSQIKIIAEPTSDPDVCRFAIDREIAPGRSISCRNVESAAGSPLLMALFAINGVREVLVSGCTITIAKSSPTSWQIMGKEIGAAIRKVIASGQEPIPSNWEKKMPERDSLFKDVEQVLAQRVNPGVASHGGRVELVDVKGTAVYLKLSGGCQGCGAANVTLRQGIEKAIRSSIPEITEVVDVTDHASGKNPFYKTKRSDGSPFK